MKKNTMIVAGVVAGIMLVLIFFSFVCQWDKRCRPRSQAAGSGCVRLAIGRTATLFGRAKQQI